MSITSQQIALLLHCLPKIGPVKIKQLIDFFKERSKILEVNNHKHIKIKGIGPAHLSEIRRWEMHLISVKKEEKFFQKKGLKLFAYGDKNYPITLQNIADPPTVFFQKGEVNWANRRIISVVGTRVPSEQGIKDCRRLIKELAPYQPIIVSGFARGIDIIAHQTAMDLGLETVAVIGHSFTRWYPPEHGVYVDKILARGAFISEFWSTDPFKPSNFLRRNRIIAGLAHATIVIESGKKGGSLATAHQALSYGREVFAFPGRTDDPKSEGCLQLIKRDLARLITCGKDMATWLAWEKAETTQAVQQQLFLHLTKLEQEVLNHLKETVSLDTLSLKMQRPVGHLASILMELELKGVVRSFAGKRFEMI